MEIQALDRTAPLLPLRPGQVERRSQDNARHGTSSLFAALDTKKGKVIGLTRQRHRSEEFRWVMDTIEANVPAEPEVHMILDNDGTHMTAMISAPLTIRLAAGKATSLEGKGEQIFTSAEESRT